ncbi:Preprotein translocase secA 1 subunit [Mycobacteroides abscessus subsp. abscessus]|nr:Preprotein translocase secA 1 subunit [Mycobacteroides abscessus subsp. abscessus]
MEYQREGFDMFTAMLDGLKEESVGFLFNLQVEVQQPQPTGVSVDPGLRSPVGATVPAPAPAAPAPLLGRAGVRAQRRRGVRRRHPGRRGHPARTS